MSDCGEPCDACGNRGTHHLCDTCCEEEAKALEAKLSEVQAVLTEDVRLDQWEKCGIIDSAFIANLRQARRERDEAQACLAFERVTVAELRAEVERLRSALKLLWEEATDESRCAVERSAGDYAHQLSTPCREFVRSLVTEGDK